MARDVLAEIREEIGRNRIMIYMKGTALFPQCGFSATTVKVFERLGVPFETVDVLADPEKRQAIKEFSNWPTIPQVYVDGKFIGGCDIVCEMYESGELQPLVRAVSGERPDRAS
jgi:monothiol glutaredoxin